MEEKPKSTTLLLIPNLPCGSQEFSTPRRQIGRGEKQNIVNCFFIDLVKLVKLVILAKLEILVKQANLVILVSIVIW